MITTDKNDMTNWDAVLRMSDEEAYTKALSDPDCPPITNGRHIHLRPEEGKTILERFRKALEREKKVTVTIRFDADIVRWFKARTKGKGYQTAMNAALRAFMEAEQSAL